MNLVIVRERSEKPHVKRRGFLAAGLIAAGAGLGALARRSETTRLAEPTPSSLDSRFAYDLSEFERTDPAQLRYKPVRLFATGLSSVRRIAASPEGVWVAGDQVLKRFAQDGRLEREWPLVIKPYCFQPLEDREILLGTKDLFVILDSDGREKWRSCRLEGRTYFTAVAVRDGLIYAADAGHREVAVFDRRSGEVVDRFGQTDSGRGNPGLAIPSPYFDLRIGPSGKLHLANTGRTRIETYTLDGRFESAWGEPGMQIDRFCGCCNPVYFALTAAGDFITSEKGLARVNIYSAAGQFKGAVAGPETLVEDRELARRACVDCRVGAGFDVAAGPEDQVFVLDPYKKTVRCFSPLFT